jgi:hypothetical protein
MPHPPSPLLELWVTYRAAAFPDACAGQQVAGVDLLQLDAWVTGCVGRYVAQGCALDANNVARLKLCVTQVQRVLPLLPPDARGYFEHLRAVAQACYLDLHGTQ